MARNSALVKNSPPAGKRNREIEISASAMFVPLFFFPPLSLSPVLSLSFYYGRCCKRLWPYASCVTSFKTTNAGYFFFLTGVWHGVAKAYEFQLWNSSFFFLFMGTHSRRLSTIEILIIFAIRLIVEEWIKLEIVEFEHWDRYLSFGNFELIDIRGNITFICTFE